MNGKAASAARWTFPLCLVLVGFVGLATWKINRPGWYQDEMLFIQAALPKSVAAQSALTTWHGIPLRVYPYIGALKAWIYRPVFGVFGLSYLSMRLPVILISAGTLILTFFCIRRLLGITTGLLVALLCALNPSFVMQSRVDWGPVVLMWFCKAAAMLFLFHWLENPKLLSRNLLGCVLFLALGFFDKINFIWIILAYGLATVTVYFPECRKAFQGVPRLVWAIIGISSMALAFLVKSIILSFLRPPDLSQLWLRLEKIWNLYVGTNSGEAICRFWFKEFSVFCGWTGGWLILAAVILVGVAGIRWQRKTGTLRGFTSHLELRLALWCLLVWLAVFIQIVLTPQAGGPHHTAVLFPFDLLAVTALGRFLWLQETEWRKWLGRVFAMGAAGWAVSCGIGLAAFYTRLPVISAYKAAWSPRMDSLARHLDQIGKSYDRIGAVDWGLDIPLRALTNKSVHRKIRTDCFTIQKWSRSDPDTNNKLNRIFPRGKRLLFILHREDCFPLCRENFLEMNRLLGNTVIPPQQNPEDVTEVYELYTIQRGEVAPNEMK